MTGATEIMVPDPLEFTLNGLSRHGALVEPAERLALLPEGIRRDLGLPEEVRLTPDPVQRDGERVPCGLGSALLSRLLTAARAEVPVAWARLLRDPPRLNHATAMGQRFVVRNGVCEVLDVFPGEAVYLCASVAYVAEADDRHEGLVRVVLNAEDGAEPDAGLCALLDLTHGRPELGPAEPVPGGAAVAWIKRRAEARVRAVLLPIQEGLLRRHQRDHARISEYFAALIEETKRPRRRMEPAAVEAKLAHLRAERDAKLLDLRTRFTLRVSVRPAALLGVRVPTARVRLRARRRKEQRELVTRLPAGAQALDRLRCDGCGGSTGRPALCDDRLHVLCEICAPLATGRPRCPACRVGST